MTHCPKCGRKLTPTDEALQLCSDPACRYDWYGKPAIPDVDDENE